MPLPPAPTKRAALLSSEAFNLKASSEFLKSDEMAVAQPAAATAQRRDQPKSAPKPEAGSNRSNR